MNHLAIQLSKSEERNNLQEQRPAERLEHYACKTENCLDQSRAENDKGQGWTRRTVPHMEDPDGQGRSPSIVYPVITSHRKTSEENDG